MEGARTKGWRSCSNSQSVAWRCSAPIATGLASAVLRTQAASHSASTGHTRAHIPPMMLDCRMVTAAPLRLPVWIERMKEGMSMPVGQASTHGASWQK